jgi:hypothetical protein
MCSLLCARYCPEADNDQCNPLLGQEQIDTPYLEYTGKPVYNETTLAAAGNYTPLSLYVVYPPCRSPPYRGVSQELDESRCDGPP